MEAVHCLKTRRSIRKFKNQSIPQEDLQEIIECGRRAPSAKNLQPLTFYVVKDQDFLVQLSEICTYGSFIQNAACCIIVLADKEAKHGIVDGSIAAENILLAAHALGYGGCWVAGHKMDYRNKILAEIGAEDQRLISILPLGVPEEQDLSPRELKDFDDVVVWNEAPQ